MVRVRICNSVKKQKISMESALGGTSNNRQRSQWVLQEAFESQPKLRCRKHLVKDCACKTHSVGIVYYWRCQIACFGVKVRFRVAKNLSKPRYYRVKKGIFYR